MELAMKPLRAADVPRVRSAVSDQLRHLALSNEVIDVATLLLSELVTNAMRHGSMPITCSTFLTGSRIRVEVCDVNTAPPVVIEAAPDALGGRGMKLVAGLAEEWGWYRTETGKCVWFELSTEVKN